ncbi:copper resistance protein B [Novosphingobium soli]|uniref:Copper resistance protein B n=1 Tax=Novosphingobium soli TaxID=574956 RepID=A0ABV6CRB2_9SPHN
MIRSLPMLGSTIALLLAAPAFAQDHSMHDMPGMGHAAQTKPAKAPTKPRASQPVRSRPKAKPADAHTPAADNMQDMDHSQHGSPASDQKRPSAEPMPAMPGMDHSQHQSGATPPSAMDPSQHQGGAMPEMPGMDHSQHGEAPMPAMEMTGTALPAGDAPPPPVPHDHYADRDFPGGEMAGSREAMMKESGGGQFGQLMLNVFEYQAHSGRDGYRWDGEGFYGGDINRLWLKSEGEGEFGRGIDSGEVQALYSHAIDPYFNLQAGVRQDFGRGPDRTYATIGFEGLAPGMFEVEGALFLSNKGDLLGRVEGYYDQRITQRLVLQPRLELNLSAQDVPENDIGSGLVNIELGARLRYEISRQFAPYVGVSYLRKTGDTARLSRLAGEDVHATSFVVGVRFWF